MLTTVRYIFNQVVLLSCVLFSDLIQHICALIPLIYFSMYIEYYCFVCLFIVSVLI